MSDVLPEGVRSFAMIEGVSVCGWTYVSPLVAALRVRLIDVGKSKLAVQGQHEKMELVYNYLAGPEFHQRVEGVVEAFVSLQTDLDSEQRSMTWIWSKRQKQLQLALSNTARTYGDLQGVIGASLPSITGLDLLLIGTSEEVATV